MSDKTAQEYINLLEGSEKAQLALLACSAALRLDDETAREAIEIVAKSNGSTGDLMRQVKSLGCVWKQWDESWYIAEDVRRYLSEQLTADVAEPTRLQLRERLATLADERARESSSDDQIIAYRARQAAFEAAYQRTLIPEQSSTGAAKLVEVYQAAANTSRAAAEATAESVNYLAPEINRHLRHLPPEVLFLQGMAARARRQKADQIRYFRAVWEQGRPGYIYAVAAFLFGLLVWDRNMAERALRDSLRWEVSDQGRVKVYHSLGNLLSKDKRRWREAEDAYQRSLKLDSDPQSRAETLHSYGFNLLSKDKQRWSDAEESYKQSLTLDSKPFSRAETLHSYGILLSKNDKRWGEAEEKYNQSLELRDNPVDRAYVYQSLGNLFSQNRDRWKDAEKAYEESLRLRDNRADKARVLAAYAELVFKFGDSQGYERAKEYALQSLKHDQSNYKTSEKCCRIMDDVAYVYETQGEFNKAAEVLQDLVDFGKNSISEDFEEELKKRIADLRSRETAQGGVEEDSVGSTEEATGISLHFDESQAEDS